MDGSDEPWDWDYTKRVMDAEMDDLCDSFSSNKVTDLSSTEEFENLSYSQSRSILVLREDEWLKKSNIRYRRYLECTNIPSNEDQTIMVIHLLILDYLSFDWEDNAGITLQAAKCVAIDFMLISYLNGGDSCSNDSF